MNNKTKEDAYNKIMASFKEGFERTFPYLELA